MLDALEQIGTSFADAAWGYPLLILLLGGGITFLLASRFLPFRYLPHAIDLLRGRYDNEAAPGEITHFQALSAALAGTIGMGNIAGVALAITIGGPGAIFWMWVTAVIGIATKFFTCTAAVMYRGVDENGRVRGGPMWVIRTALGPRLQFLATLFCIAGLIGCLPAVQTNQLVQISRDLFAIPAGILSVDGDHRWFNAAMGVLIAITTATVMLGGLKRVARVATGLVPAMALLYVGTAGIVIAMNLHDVPGVFALIVSDAFTGDSVAGGALGTVILYGVQRGAFSNEAGIGTEALAHGAARTSEPVREGLVAMVGPIVDTLLICTATALTILLSGVHESTDASGVTLTAAAFSTSLGLFGTVVIATCVLAFSMTTIFTYNFYGEQCFAFLFGARRGVIYRWIFIAFIIVAAMVSLDTAIGFIDGAFALMAIPTMTATLLLMPKILAAARDYFERLNRADEQAGKRR